MASQVRILGSIDYGRFIGRGSELEKILVIQKTRQPVVKALLCEPGSGATELLLQAFDSLYHKNHSIPVYFSLREAESGLKQLADKFLYAISVQLVAAKKREPRLLHGGITFSELKYKAGADAAPLQGLERYYFKYSESQDEGEYLLQALGAAARLTAAGYRVFLLIDDWHYLESSAGQKFSQKAIEKLTEGGVCGIFAGWRRAVYPQLPYFVKTITLSRAHHTLCREITKRLAELKSLDIRDPIMDLLIVQLGGDLKLISALLDEISERGLNIDSYQEFESLYTSEIYGGRLSKIIDERLAVAAGSQFTVDELIRAVIAESQGDFPSGIGFGPEGEKMPKKGLLRRLKQFELLDETGNLNKLTAFKDRCYVLTEESAGKNRALSFARSFLAFMKRAGDMMDAHYREAYRFGLREALELFDGSEVPTLLIDNCLFTREFVGAPEAEIFAEARRDKSRVQLPRIYYSTATENIYPAIGTITSPQTCRAGFAYSNHLSEPEEVWIAVEIDSKLELNAELTEFWCDRLEMAAIFGGLTNYRLWLVAKEGFGAEAKEVLRRRGALGTSKKQLELLRRYLEGDQPIAEELGMEKKESDEGEQFEVSLPMEENAELVAARIAEDLARRHNFDSRSINQIKTALIEAFINAVEHGKSPDRRVHQRFVVSDRQFTVTITNRGVRFRQDPAASTPKENQQRGWGLELVKKLMDDVKIEDSDEGMKISMTKFSHH
jgi:serine/threonine-protein kinase RsbW